VDLPSYQHSFIVQVPRSSSILNVKQEIFRTCVGAPRADGQRLIWRGRNLHDDERVEDILTVKVSINALLACCPF
jgi:Ubiquitin family